MSQTRQDARWRELTGPTYAELGHHDTIDWHYHDVRQRAIAALRRADPAETRTLADLGMMVGASDRTLSRLFRQEAGMSFPQWRTQLRLQHALVLLADGTPVTSTALACGWSNPSA